jgi:hypothetical protein
VRIGERAEIFERALIIAGRSGATTMNNRDMNEQDKARAKLRHYLEMVMHDVEGALTNVAAGANSLARFADDPAKRQEMLKHLPGIEEISAQLQSIVAKLKE